MTRAVALLGLAFCVPLIWFGSIWPSVFSVIALLVLPAAVILIAVAIAPSIASRYPRVTLYALVAAAVSLVCDVFQAWWLATHWQR